MSCSSPPEPSSAMAFNLDDDEIGCIIFGDLVSIEEGDPVIRPGASSRSWPVTPSRARRRRSWSVLIDEIGGHPIGTRNATSRCRCPMVSAPARQGTVPLHGHHGDRRDDRPSAGRTAPADHRRSVRRGRPPSPSTRSSPRSSTGETDQAEVHLRRDRPEGVDRAEVVDSARAGRASSSTTEREQLNLAPFEYVPLYAGADELTG